MNKTFKELWNEAHFDRQIKKSGLDSMAIIISKRDAKILNLKYGDIVRLDTAHKVEENE